MEMFDMAFWSIVPALLTIALAIITKEVLLAMFIGVFTGCMFIENLNPLYALAKMVEIFLGVYNPEDGTLIPGAITEPGSAMVLIIIILIGGFIGLMVKSGASLAFAELLSSKVSSPKRARCTVWLIGMLLFFDDYFNDLTNGTIMRPISDRYEVPREKLAYIIDSTTVGICQISPISTWVAFICSLMGGGLVTAGIEGDAFKLFIQAIPYNYYAWVSLAMVISVAYFNINYGPMATAERRTAKSGLVCEKSFGGDAGDDDFAGIEIAKGKANDLIVPLLILIVGVLLFLLYTGGFFQHFDFLQTVNSMDGILAMTYAFLITVVFCVVYFAIKGLSSVMDSIAAIVIGAKSVLYAMMVLSFGWALGGICEEMNAVGFMISAFQGNIPQFMTPFIAFLFAGLMTFA
ncbi:MAG: Na+/H+ antiporter NhaC family protein, partial [Anaerovorax sp.]